MVKKKKKHKRRLKIQNIILILLILVFLISMFKIIIFLLDTNENKKNNNKLSDEVVKIKSADAGKEEIEINFNKLLEKNSDTVGWIKFNSDKVNNPIVHTKDNEYYLTHSFNKKKNQAGTIFMDYRNISFDDKNVVLFGHSMSNKTMFGSIEEIFKQNFFDKKENNYIQIIDKENRILTYQIFSYYTVEKEEYYITTSFDTDNDFQQFINTVEKRSHKNFNINVSTKDKILTLSTCSGSGNTNKRQVVHAKRI